jgi:hypothetical protein
MPSLVQNLPGRDLRCNTSLILAGLEVMPAKIQPWTLIQGPGSYENGKQDPIPVPD